ncbi:MAG: DUF4369 domain-containing protein [Prevotella sp.]|jgi:hypothetical protein|nr:DUF4369 domain-containing protein [Prevotella sp.]MCI1282567.1 DUF4369 domain-containing protein [Prevotella sp.]
MKKIAYLILLTLVVASCGTDRHHFKLEGSLLHINQGEFYIYSTDGSINGIDTIKVQGGRLAFEMACERPTTLILVFPNFSEQPIFAEPGSSVKLKADASHLKEMEVTGTDENKLMNQFRKQVVDASPPETVKFAAQFIKDHPESAVSVYLVRKYFITAPQPDYKQAFQLIRIMQKQQPKNGTLNRLALQLKALSTLVTGARLPAFTAYDVRGNRLSNAVLNAPIAVVSVWASWSFDSQNFQRALKPLIRKSHGRLKALSICVDPSKKDCQEALKRDSLSWPTICDGQMLETPILKTLGLYSVPDNILLQNGKIIARGLNAIELQNRLEKMI